MNTTPAYLTAAIVDALPRGFTPELRELQEAARAWVEAEIGERPGTGRDRDHWRTRWFINHVTNGDRVHVHAVVPGLGWAVPIDYDAAARITETNPTSLHLSRPYPGAGSAPYETA